MTLYINKDFEVGKNVGDIADELIIVRNKTNEIENGNECIDRCKNCPVGFIFIIDTIEKIGQCNYCFFEYKLS